MTLHALFLCYKYFCINSIVTLFLLQIRHSLSKAKSKSSPLTGPADVDLPPSSDEQFTPSDGNEEDTGDTAEESPASDDNQVEEENVETDIPEHTDGEETQTPMGYIGRELDSPSHPAILNQKLLLAKNERTNRLNKNLVDKLQKNGFTIQEQQIDIKNNGNLQHSSNGNVGDVDGNLDLLEKELYELQQAEQQSNELVLPSSASNAKLGIDLGNMDVSKNTFLRQLNNHQQLEDNIEVPLQQ